MQPTDFHIRREEESDAAALSLLFDRSFEWLAEAITAGIEDGEFAPCDAGAVADRALALIDGFGVRALLGDPKMPLERARDEVWGVLERDLGLQPAGAAGTFAESPFQ